MDENEQGRSRERARTHFKHIHERDNYVAKTYLLQVIHHIDAPKMSN
jgi:hypothetical protein